MAAALGLSPLALLMAPLQQGQHRPASQQPPPPQAQHPQQQPLERQNHPQQQHQQRRRRQRDPNAAQLERLRDWEERKRARWERKPDPENLPPGWITVMKYLPNSKPQEYFIAPDGCPGKGKAFYLRTHEERFCRLKKRRSAAAQGQQPPQQQQQGTHAQGQLGNAPARATGQHAPAAAAAAVVIDAPGASPPGAATAHAAPAAPAAGAVASSSARRVGVRAAADGLTASGCRAPAPAPAPAAGAPMPAGAPPPAAAPATASRVLPAAAAGAVAGAGAGAGLMAAGAALAPSPHPLAAPAAAAAAAPAAPEVGDQYRWLRPPAEVGQDVAAVVQEVHTALKVLPLSDDQRRGLRKYLLAVTSCPQRAATFVGAQYPLLVDSQEWGQEELVDSLATLAGPMLT